MILDHIDMLKRVSRTFALSIDQLPNILRDSVSISYLLLRVSDCLEDNEAIPAKEKPQLLRLWASILVGGHPVGELINYLRGLDGACDPEVFVAQHADYILGLHQRLPEEVQSIICNYVKQTSLGMARWQEHGPYVETEAEMDDYMHQVAGLVGYLLTDLFAWYSKRIAQRKEYLRPLAREYGLALQTVNIIRGMRKDYERGWVFVPRTFYESVGLTRDGIFDPANADKAILLVNMLADKAERHLINGIAYITSFPCIQHRIRLGCMWPLFFAVKTLAISRNNIQVILDEAKISRQQVTEIIKKTTLFGWSNRWLKSYYQELLTPATL